jgi:hypothetical protein
MDLLSRICSISAVWLSTTALQGCAAVTSESAIPQVLERLVVINECPSQTIWIASSQTVPGPRNVMLPPNGFYKFQIPLGGLASTRFWPKGGCDAQGENCKIGSSGGPGQDCPADIGCAPPVDSKFEATWGSTSVPCKDGSSGCDWWDTSAVDGFTFPYSLTVDSTCPQGKPLHCESLKMSDCPTAENLGSAGIQSLIVNHPGENDKVGCYSPCSKLTASNWNNTVGRHDPTDSVAQMYCCPTPPISPAQCKTGPVAQTQFVNLIHNKCTNVYGFAYDDAVGLQTCQAGTVYTWSIYCAEESSQVKIQI